METIMAPRKKAVDQKVEATQETQTVEQATTDSAAQEMLQALSAEQQNSISITEADIRNAHRVLEAAMNRAKDVLELDELVTVGTFYKNMKGYVECIETEKEFSFGIDDIENFVVIVSNLSARKNVFGIDEYVFVGTVYSKFVTVLNISKEIRALSEANK
jgi:hypothetical protein